MADGSLKADGSPQIAQCFAMLVAVLTLGWSAPAITEPTNSSASRGAIKMLTLAHADHPLLLAQAGDAAQSQAILFVHGSPGRWDAFERYLTNPKLIDRALLVSYDRPGWGQSGSAEESVGLFANQSAAAVRIMSEYPHKRWIIVGHSLGASIAPQIMLDARSQAQTVDALILIAGSLSPTLGKSRWYNHVADTALMGFLLGSSLRQSNREIMALRQELTQLETRLQGVSLTTRVAILQGQHDTLVNPANVDYARRHWAGIFSALKIEVIADAGHFLPWQQSSEVLSAIIAELDAEPQSLN